MLLTIMKLSMEYTDRAEIWSKRGASRVEWFLSIKLQSNNNKILPSL